jgi:carbonic anhydrase/acetyltransferase-like protein (isoleucine patch superfamily)
VGAKAILGVGALVDGAKIEERSFVASLLWMTAKNGLDGKTERLGEEDRPR